MENLLLPFVFFFFFFFGGGVLVFFGLFFGLPACGKRTARHSPSPDLVSGV